jgi:hypothetical protein
MNDYDGDGSIYVRSNIQSLLSKPIGFMASIPIDG